MKSAESSVRMLVLEAVYQALGPVKLPDYPGTSFRGAFGAAFRGRVCLTGLDECGPCSLKTRCAYHEIWEQPTAPDGAPKRFSQPPKPYVIEHHEDDEGRTVMPGEFTSVRVKIFGSAIARLPFLLLALHDLGWQGIGRGRGRMVLRECAAMAPDGTAHIVFDNDTGLTGCPVPCWQLATRTSTDRGRVTLQFRTPTTLKSKGRLLERFDPETFTARLLDRFELMSLFYEGRVTDSDYRRFRALARDTRIVDDGLDSSRFQRVSRRSGRIPVQGVVGEVVVDHVDPDLIGLWRLAEHLHVGKQATFGFGHVIVRTGVSC